MRREQAVPDRNHPSRMRSASTLQCTAAEEDIHRRWQVECRELLQSRGLPFSAASPGMESSCSTVLV